MITGQQWGIKGRSINCKKKHKIFFSIYFTSTFHDSQVNTCVPLLRNSNTFKVLKKPVAVDGTGDATWLKCKVLCTSGSMFSLFKEALLFLLFFGLLPKTKYDLLNQTKEHE